MPAVRRRAPLLPDHLEDCRLFFFFSNRLGCLGSLLVSVVLTGILLLIFVF